MTNEKIGDIYAKPQKNYISFNEALNLARQDEREKMQGVEVALNAGDYVINSKRQLKQIHSIEPRENDNLRYNFTDGSFGLKNEKHLGGLQCGNYTKIDVSAVIRNQLTTEAT